MSVMFSKIGEARFKKGLILTLACIGLLFGMAIRANASVIVLTFEGIGDSAAVNDFYNGGTDSAGNSGPDYGINFSDSSLGLIDSDAGGTGNFANEPSPDTVLFFRSGGAATMNVAAGFDTGFSFYYASSRTGSVTIYDGLNGTGNILATLSLDPVDSSCSGDPTGVNCAWVPVGVSFSGIAHSVDFGGTANLIAFDNITLGSPTPVRSVPEPGVLGMMGLGLLLLTVLYRRRRLAEYVPADG